MMNLTKTVIAAFILCAGMASAAPGLLVSDRAVTVKRDGLMMSDRAAPRADGILIIGRDGIIVTGRDGMLLSD